MGIFASIRERRVLQWLGGYIAAGFLALEGVDQLVGYAILPELAYHITLVFYLAGMPAAFILAWFHGQRGTQKPPAAEIWLLGAVAVAALGATAIVVRDYQASRAREVEAAELGFDPRRVAVLYFDDLSTDQSLGYLADGLSEALIDVLSRVRALDVISRNGVAPYRGTEITPDSIARVLATGSLIDGSVESVGDELRVTARLVDGISGADIERTTFNVPAGEFLAARDSVARRVGSILRQRLGEEVRLRERRAGTESTEAWALVQRAERLRKEAEEQLREDLLQEAVDNFQRADSVLALAEAADPEWVEPIALRAHTAFRHARTSIFLDDLGTSTDQIDLGIDHADRALVLEPNHAGALEYRGTLQYLLWLLGVTPDPAERDQLFADARADLEAAVRADPTLATAHSMLSHLYINTDEEVAVVLAARQAYEEDAYLVDADQVLLRLFWGHYNLEQFTEAQRWADEGLRRFQGDYLFIECQLWMMITEQAEPDVDRAWLLAATIDSVTPEDRRPFYSRVGELIAGGVIGRAGDMDSALAVLERPGPDREFDPYYDLEMYEAAVRSVLGDHEGAIELLREFTAANPGAFAHGEERVWWWRPLRGNPDFQALVASSQ
jgi:serine/threonine-protein kinase